jgi:hypothetical protein
VSIPLATSRSCDEHHTAALPSGKPGMAEVDCATG